MYSSNVFAAITQPSYQLNNALFQLTHRIRVPFGIGLHSADTPVMGLLCRKGHDRMNTLKMIVQMKLEELILMPFDFCIPAHVFF